MSGEWGETEALEREHLLSHLEGQRPEGELGRHGGKKIGCEVGKSPTEGEMMSDDYVGLPEDEATVQAYNNGFDVVRIISRDGNYFPVTRDYREDRINFNIEETLVVQASVG